MTPRAVDPLFFQLQALLAGRFSLEREIGRGGMGIVYLARDVALERPVAIKVLSPTLAARRDMRERFLREARIAAQCFHPHIVPIHAVEEADALAWIVMAYVRGETLADRLRRTGPLSAEEVRRLAREVGWALAYAHQRGVVHRDIKPENLLIDASTGRYVIADFGIAQAADQSSTPVGGGVAGTARYMAPEQALGESIDGRADLYALGVTLFIAASGRPPFEAESALALVAQHATQPAPSIRAFAPTLPLELARAIDRCLAKRAEERYPDAGHFLTAIEPDVREQPLSPALRAVRDHAGAARTMVWWAAVIGLTTVLLIAGEEARSFGRAIIGTVGYGVTVLFAAAAALRGIEALLETRRVLRLGHDPDDIVRALMGDRDDGMASHGVLRSAGSATLQLFAGISLAIGQGWLSSLSLPEVFVEVLQAAAVLLPPMLIARGAEGLLASTSVGRWLRDRFTDRVTAPLARTATRLLAGLGFSRAESRRLDALADAPTEMLLVRAVEAAVEALPEAQRAAMSDVDALAHALARQVAALRADGLRLDGREAEALVLPDSAARAGALDEVMGQRAVVQARLQTAMAALESLRLDVLQFGLQHAATGLTTELSQLRDLQRRVDAAREVRQLLRTPT